MIMREDLIRAVMKEGATRQQAEWIHEACSYMERKIYWAFAIGAALGFLIGAWI